MKCPHVHLVIIENGIAITRHEFDCQEWFHDSDFDGYTSMIDIECRDCGLTRRYNTRKLPLWLKGRYDDAQELRTVTHD